MIKLEFSIKIKADRKTIWETLFGETTFPLWAGIIDEGTYMKGSLKEGQEVQFLSGSSGYGVTSLVERLIDNQYVLFRHKADTKDLGKETRDREWTGGSESYQLIEDGESTKLTVTTEVPKIMEQYFKDIQMVAMECIRKLAEEKMNEK